MASRASERKADKGQEGKESAKFIWSHLGRLTEINSSTKKEEYAKCYGREEKSLPTTVAMSRFHG